MKIITIMLVVPMFLQGQTYGLTKGVKWEPNLTWVQIINKAKVENKLIFIDCFATWCGPCKKMDEEVYSSERIGKILQEQYLSVKVQMDSSVSGDVLYDPNKNTVFQFVKDYNIKAYPALLVFDANGRIVRKLTGYKKESDFLSILKETADPETRYYSLLESYLKGKCTLDGMRLLASNAKEIGDEVLSKRVADSYITVLKDLKGLAASDIRFIRDVTSHTSDMGFKFIMDRADSVNKVMGDEDYSQGIVATILYKEFILPDITKYRKDSTIKELDWIMLDRAISQMYGAYYARRVLTDAKINWYYLRHNWNAYAANLIESVDKSSKQAKLNGYYINNNAWNIFQKSNNPAYLKQAAEWMTYLIANSPGEDKVPENFDTYANLLYKIGDTVGALEAEKNAIKLEEERSRILNKPPDQIYSNTLEKMRKSLQKRN